MNATGDLLPDRISESLREWYNCYLASDWGPWDGSVYCIVTAIEDLMTRCDRAESFSANMSDVVQHIWNRHHEGGPKIPVEHVAMVRNAIGAIGEFHNR